MTDGQAFSRTTRSTTFHAIGAMAVRKRGQAELVVSELARAKEFSQRTVGPSPMTFEGQAQGNWQDGGIARSLFREAEDPGN